MFISFLTRSTVSTLSTLILVSAMSTAGAQEETQYLPSLSYRTGPFAPSGIGVADGFADYVTLINERDNGVNGVRILLEECETGYANDRGVECYERLKDRHGGATVVAPLSTGITYALIPRSRGDGIVMTTMGYGRSDAAYGPVIDNVFMAPISHMSSMTIMFQYIANQEGGWENLKGKTIVHAYHDSAYGREPIPVLRHYAAEYDFNLHEVPISPPGVEQRSVWQQIRRINPDWVTLLSWGVMSPTALRTAHSMGIDMERIIGGHYVSQEDAVVPAGAAAIGYKAASFHGAGSDFPVFDDIKKYVVDRGLASGDGRNVGEVAYNRGMIMAAYIVEAWRQAQAEFGEGKASTREETLWAWQQLSIDNDLAKELGMYGLIPTVQITCENHEGDGLALIQKWDGKRWIELTDFMAADMDVVFPMYKATAEQYAEEQSITPRSCD